MKAKIFFVFFLLFLLAFIFLTYKDYGVVFDEKVFLMVGRYYTALILNTLAIPHNLIGTRFEQANIHIKTHGVVFDVFVFFLTLFFNRFSFELYHLLKALLSLPTFILLFSIVKKLLNEKLAVASVIFLALFPRFYGDIFVNSVDVPNAFFFSLAFFYFLYFLKSNQAFLKQIFFSLILAVLVSQRALFVYVLGVDLAVLFLFNRLVKKENLKDLIFKTLTVFVSTVVFAHLTHPYLFQNPVKGVIEMMTAAQKFPFQAAVLFDGQLFEAAKLPWYYLPKTMLITIPEAILFLFFLGIFYLLSFFLKKNSGLTQKIISLYLLLLFFAPILINFFLRPLLYDSWRHFLFLTVPLIVIACFGVDYLLNIKIKVVFFASLFFVGLNLFLVGREMVQLHPYQYIYYNSLIGGLKGAYLKYETDYWGVSYKEGVYWFNKNINLKDKFYKIKVEGDPLSSSYYFLKNMKLIDNPLEADYVITFTRWGLDKFHQGEVIYTVERQGVPLVYIKKGGRVRGF